MGSTKGRSGPGSRAGRSGGVGRSGGAAGQAVANDDLASDGYSIDELAALTGVPTRTIRFYQSKGALPHPERDGARAKYGPEYVDRLRLIGQLQDRGLKLGAIRDLLKEAEKGDFSPTDWLGMTDHLRSPWSDDAPRIFGEAEIVAHADAGDRPGRLNELIRVGLVERQDGSLPPTYLVRSPALLDAVLRLEAAGVDLDVATTAAEIVRRKIGKAAGELIDLFAKEAGSGFGRKGDLDGFAKTIEAVRPDVIELVKLVFAREMERALTEFVEEGASHRLRRG